ncbi:hypothetical protein EV175_001501 [Coemansia sp. RSA 1933]|nr:hypothetical protein EV175_001501 [Coemansia sp. RSA 1933]
MTKVACLGTITHQITGQDTRQNILMSVLLRALLVSVLLTALLTTFQDIWGTLRITTLQSIHLMDLITVQTTHRTIRNTLRIVRRTHQMIATAERLGAKTAQPAPPVPCITELCPPERFVCLPLAAPDDSTDSHIPAAPETNGPGRKNKFKEFFACIEEHDGSVVWNHPTEPCNNCRCLPGGGISCTKKLCSDNVATEEAANSIVYVVDVAV